MNNYTDTKAEGFKDEKAIVTPYNIRELQAKNNITKQLYVTHIGYYPNAKEHYRIRPNGGTENIFIYCNKGRGWIEHGGVRHILNRNQAYIIPKGDPHSYGADKQKPWSIYWIHFKGENAPDFAAITNTVITIDDSDSSRQQDRIQLFEEIYQNLEMGYRPENLEYISYCLMYFFASIKYLHQYREINKVKVDDVIQKSIVFMKNNLEEQITLDDIVEHVKYSKSRFISLFKEKTSYSPIVYYNQLRIQRACAYLQFSELKLKEISFRLGFYDPFHFSRAFQQQMEISPSEYRKRYKDK
ncbi:AraC family transcriptional regulator [Prevotella sp. 10(H)]|uniref:AraC family transcriptional regulator n=1 Tax=Prevotella sp. 10(H) TaxID=1158294 RepID=UPI0004A75613|nr:AraC family transcriptional regulator [Prevotella sp. 10(H)]